MVFDELKEAVEAAQREQDLPDLLAEQIRFIVENPERFSGREADVARLAEMVTLYDTYGQTGYLGMGASNLILEQALRKLLDGPAEQGEK